VKKTTLKLAPLAAIAAVALIVVGTVSGAGHKQSRTAKSSTLVFAGAADPVVLDGALVSDGESLRAIDQIFDTLVTLKPGTTTVVPDLAKSWKNSGHGKTWIFHLRHGVKFQDGTKFNAKAVCYNFKRWYNFSGPFQDPDATYYWQTVFLGFHHNAAGSGLQKSLFKSCKAKGKYTAKIKLAKPFGPFIPAMSLPSFSIASPKALKKYHADSAKIVNGVFTPTGSYGFKHPTGTGPFKFKSWRIGDRLVLVRNPHYWGKKAKLKKLIIRPIGDATARLQALQTGEIMGYDLVSPEHIKTIKHSSKMRLLKRPGFNVGYVTIHQGKGSPMNSLKVRQAVAYGLNRKALVRIAYPPGAVVAKEFQPPQLFGWTKKVKSYSYKPSKAKSLLNSSPCHVPCHIDFWYPSSISRQYMPNPKRNFEVFQAGLTAAGFRVTAHTAPWRPDYVKKVDLGQAGDLNLIGWNGDYGDPDDWLGIFFGAYSAQFGFHNSKIFHTLQKARQSTNQAKRIKLYKKANQMIMKTLPGVPYVHSPSFLAFQKRVKGYHPSPVGIEPFSKVYIK
jgi:peptide/nickel transport system substrate-binding protein